MTKFQEWMDANQLRQYQLHKATGFSASQVSEWQRGIHRPSLKSVRRIAFVLGLPLKYLKSQLELRECNQNAISPDGSFVCRTKKNRQNITTNIETNDPVRSSSSSSSYCLLCHKKLEEAA